MKTILEVVASDIITGDDGYKVFWPYNNRGCYTAKDLREIADELDKRNEAWDKQVQEYFNKEDS